MRRLALIAAVMLSLATPAGAQPTPSESQRLLLESVSPEDLRARLSALADSAGPTAPQDAGEALYYLGASFERAGLVDSAIAAYRRAVRARGADDERLALVDGLLLRRAEGDVDSALVEIRRRIPGATAERPGVVPDYRAHEAWALALAGHADSARVLFAALPPGFETTPEWRYRIGFAEARGGDPRRAYSLLRPLAVNSRTRDKQVMDLVNEIAQRTGLGRRLIQDVEQGIGARDRRESVLIGPLGARRVQFRAADGFPLGGVLIAPRGTARRRAAVVLLAPGDSVADYDTLAVTLQSAGFSVLLMDVRGSGWSVDAPCPLPDTWRWRDERLQALCARDVREALNRFGAQCPVDTSRYLLVASGRSAPIAAAAAALDPRVAALVMVSPVVPPVELGPMRARLQRLRLPAYFQIAGDEHETYATSDVLFHAGDERRSRFAESTQMPHGPMQFYFDPAVRDRFTRWLRETMPARARPSARPSKPRRG